MQTVLTIAGFDPSSGAGVTADLMVFAALGLYGTAAITGLTVQSTLGVQASHPVEQDILRETLACLNADVRPAGIKIGMVGTHGNVLVISTYIRFMNIADSEGKPSPTVLDPIFTSSSGCELLGTEGAAMLKKELLPLVDWVTPNAPELAALTRLPVRSTAELAAAARALQEDAGPRHAGSGRLGLPIGVFAKGGHLDKPDDLLLMPDGAEHWLAGERIETNSTHGTGCALSSAFLSRLVLGDAPLDAAMSAKAYVAEAMRQAPGIGQGKGPLNLLWPLRGTQSR